MNGMDAGTRAALIAAREAGRGSIRKWRHGEAHRALEALFADCAASDAEEAMNRATKLLRDGGWAGALLQPLIEDRKSVV